MIAHRRTATVAAAVVFSTCRHSALNLLIAAAVMACNTTHAAQPPTVDRLVPAGGQRGTTVPVKITGKLGEGELRVVNDSGQSGYFSWTFNEKRDAADVAIVPDAPAGVHWIRFCNPAGSTELRPFVVGTIPEIAETEPNNRIADANPVQSESVTINAALDKGGDVDTYAVPVAAGRTLVASITANRVLKSPMDGVLQVVDSRGTVVAQNDDDASRDPLVEFTAPADGTWYVRVFAFPAEPNSSIAFAGGADYLYRLTVTTADCLHHASPLVRQIGTGELRLQLHGWNLQAPEAVLGATHQSLEGPFALPWKVPAVPEPVLIEDQLTETRSLTPPAAVSASLLQSAADEYVINAVKGAKFSIVAQVEDFSSLLDPVLTLTDPAGKAVKESDDGEGGNRDARIDFTAAVDGPHQIAVQDRFLASGPRFFYLLRIVPTQPEVQLSVKSTAIVLSAEKPAEIPVAVVRSNGYAEPLDFRVEGLPEGVTAECPQSAKDGDSSKAITIKLNGRPAGLSQWAGPIQILAAPPAAANQAPLAAPVPVEYSAPDGTLIRSFWLTIPPMQAAPAPAG
jgi:hypothetical protein